MAYEQKAGWLPPLQLESLRRRFPRALSPAAERKAFRAEATLSWVRLVTVWVNILTYWLFFSSQGVPWLAAAISVAAAIYGVGIVIVQPYRRFPILLTAAWTAVTDGLLVTLWIYATGAYFSPYHPIWELSLIAVTFRYDWRATALTTAGYIALYSGLLWYSGDWPAHSHVILVRLSYIGLVGAAGTLLARESRFAFDEAYELGQHVRESEGFRTLAEASPEPLVIHRRGTILLANRAVGELFGDSPERLVGRHVLDLVSVGERVAGEQRLQRPSDAPFDATAVTPKGLRTLQIEGRDFVYGGQPARVAVLRDVTAERHAQARAQEALRAELEVERLREVGRFRADFINQAAHELNTPLTPLRLQVDMLALRLPPEEAHAVGILRRSVDRLGLLVRDMLDVARLDAQRLPLQRRPVDLATVVQASCDTFAALARERQVSVKVDVPPLTVEADEVRLGQVLDNLVGNALKFTPAGGVVHVRARHEPGWAILQVEDSGIGLTEAQLEQLFQPFAQLHSDVRPEGTGLGLYISRGLVQRHGGTLTAASQGPGTGAVFTVTLPIPAPSTGAPDADGPSKAPPVPLAAVEPA